MSDDEQTPITKPCGWPGGACRAPRKVFPSGKVWTWCAGHASEVSQRNKRKPALDPVTGETVTVGQLAARNHWRKRQAARKAAQEERS